MKRRLLPVFLTTALLSGVLFPGIIAANSEAENLIRELEKIDKKIKQAQFQKAQTEKQIQNNQNQIQKLGLEVQSLEQDIGALEKQLAQKQKEIEEAERKLVKTAVELEAANERIQQRDQILKARLRLMYTNGFVSYLDVLLNSTSFMDFLDRFHALEAILHQDKDILEANKRDKALIEEKKKEQEQQLAQIEKLYEEQLAVKTELDARKRDRQVRIASLQSETAELMEIREQDYRLLDELAKQKAELYRKYQSISYYKGGKLLWPLPGKTYISSGFGSRVDPITGQKGVHHRGIDIPAPQGTTIVAAESGIVFLAQWVSGYGYTVMIDHGNGLSTLYAHIRQGGIKVKEGQKVKRGDKIAEVGATGRVTGAHLHFEVRKNNQAVNPIPYLK